MYAIDKSVQNITSFSFRKKKYLNIAQYTIFSFKLVPFYLRNFLFKKMLLIIKENGLKIFVFVK